MRVMPSYKVMSTRYSISWCVVTYMTFCLHSLNTSELRDMLLVQTVVHFSYMLCVYRLKGSYKSHLSQVGIFDCSHLPTHPSSATFTQLFQYLTGT